MNADQIQATLEHGILRLEIPKSTQVQPRRIAVQTALQGQSQSVGATSQAPARPADEQERKLDQEAMDRAAQAGVEGAFGAAPDAGQTREQLREDAERAFEGGNRAVGQGRESS